MNSKRKIAVLLAFLLSISSFFSAPAPAADSTSFNPLSISISAETSSGVPIGTVIAWPVASNPSDWDKWLECNGQSISATVYPELRALVGANVPDYRGLFLRGNGSQAHSKNNGSTVGTTSTTHSSGSLGAVQGDAIRNISAGIDVDKISSTNQPMHTSVVGAFSTTSGNWANLAPTNASGNVIRLNFNASNVVPTANENRPVNMAVRYLIKAFN